MTHYEEPVLTRPAAPGRRPLLRPLLALHRWLGLLACLAVLMFASSGLLHPIMSRTQPQPVQRMAPAPQFGASVVPLAKILRDHAIDTFVAATTVQLADGAAYRVQVDANAARYFNAADGAEIADGERRHAELLARYFSGETDAALAELQEQTEFDADYLPVNRLLPVWRARFERDDGLAVYVDTRGNRIATQVDDRKRTLQTIFRNMHDFDFFDAWPLLRMTTMLVLLIAAFATAIAGIVLFFKLKGSSGRVRRSATRRWHRRLALPIAITTLTFSASGAWHLLQGESAAATAVYPASAQTFHAAEFADATTPHQAFSLLRIDGKPCYRIAGDIRPAPDEHAHHPMGATGAPPAQSPQAGCIGAASGLPVADADRYTAIELARRFSGSTADVKSLEQIVAFSGEYGFINKRLPVWKVVFADSATRWYVETASGALALRADDNAALEGFVFAYVHKWNFFGEHKDARDVLMMLFACGNVVVALLGLWLFFTRPMRAA